MPPLGAVGLFGSAFHFVVNVKWCKRLPDIIYPQESPSIINGKRFALAKYNAAVCPAGPEPITLLIILFIITF